ncbi:nAD+ synthase [Clostridium sp. CAG:568]|nr:nAD+ synthase [Clostridium sp. CAG:568]
MKNDGFIKVAAITSNVHLNDINSNVNDIVSKAKEANEMGAKIITFQELALTGYSLQDMFAQSNTLEKAKEGLIEITNKTKDLDLLMVVSLPYSFKGKIYDTAAVISKGKILGIATKKYLPNYNEFYDARYFTPSFDENEVTEIDGNLIPIGPKLLFHCREIENLTIGIEICEDLWTPDTPSTHHAMNGATLILNPSASNEMVGKENYRKSLISSTSARLICAYVYAGAGEGETSQDVVYSAPLIIAENGNLLGEKNDFNNHIMVKDIDVDLLAFRRRQMTTYSYKQEKGYQTIDFSLTDSYSKSLDRIFVKSPYLDISSKNLEDNLNTIFNCQSHGLMKRIQATHCKTVIIGVSGGLDSALALLVAYKAFKDLSKDVKDIIAISMPCFATTTRTRNNSKILAETLGITFKEIDISNTVKSHLKDIDHPLDLYDAAYENAQARARTYVLMDESNYKSGIVIGTGDLSEIALGWATYNGDQMSMYNVNASVPKTVVKEVVRMVANNERESNPLLSKTLIDILDTPITPELVPSKSKNEISQITEDIIGPYILHDFFLYHFLRNGYQPLKILRIAIIAFKDMFNEETIKNWLKLFYRRFFASQFKRSAAPDGVKVGSVSLSQRGDLRIPSDLLSVDFLKDLK